MNQSTAGKTNADKTYKMESAGLEKADIKTEKLPTCESFMEESDTDRASKMEHMAVTVKTEPGTENTMWRANREENVYRAGSMQSIAEKIDTREACAMEMGIVEKMHVNRTKSVESLVIEKPGINLVSGMVPGTAGRSDFITTKANVAIATNRGAYSIGVDSANRSSMPGTMLATAAETTDSTTANTEDVGASVGNVDCINQDAEGSALDLSWLSSGDKPLNIADLSFEQFQLLYYQHLFRNMKDLPTKERADNVVRSGMSSKVHKASKAPIKPTNIVTSSTSSKTSSNATTSNTTPGNTKSINIKSINTKPSNTKSSNSMSGNTKSSDAMTSCTLPSNTTSSNITSSNTTSSKTMSSNTPSGNSTSGNTTPSNTTPSNTTPTNTLPGDTMPCKTTSNTTSSDLPSETTPVKPVGDKPSQKPPGDGFTHKCSRCEETFRSRLELTAHDKRAHSTDWDSDLQCKTCKKKFSSKYYLNQHELIHKGELPFPCAHCDKRFLCKGTLETHVILLHTEDRPHKCEECGAAFKLKKILMRHVATHTKEAPYKCPSCDKCFSRRGSLNRHELIHTGEKPYKCDQCEKSFTQKSTLTLHMMGHTNERPYQCTKCDKSFRKKSHLTRHDSVHTGKKRYYECQVCKKCFAEKYCLVEHEKTHSDSAADGVTATTS